MAHYAPGSQSRALLAEKEEIACRLLGKGLTVTQICGQLRCSPYFVRRARSKMEERAQSAPPNSLPFFDQGKLVVEAVHRGGEAWL